MITSKGGSAPRAGAPTSPSLPVRSTAEERARWTAAATARGLTLSAWVREALDARAAIASMASEPAEPPRLPSDDAPGLACVACDGTGTGFVGSPCAMCDGSGAKWYAR